MNKTYLGVTVSCASLLALGIGVASVMAQNAAPSDVAELDVIADAAAARIGDASPNFIFMIGDDMGLDTLNCYAIGSGQAHTPNLDALCAAGMRFDNFWSQPVCSPTRATLLTGQYGFMNGIGAPVGSTPGVEWNIPGGVIEASPTGMGGGMTATNTRGGDMGAGGMGGGMGSTNGMGNANGMGGANEAGSSTSSAQAADASYDLVKDAPAPHASVNNSDTGLRADHNTFLKALKTDTAKGYALGAVGKWHLAGSGNGGLEHPNRVGFDHYSGPMRGGFVTSYEAWSKTTNNNGTRGVTGYVTSDTVDDAITWINTVEGKKPFFLWVAFNAPHTPLHMPPKALLSSDLKKVDPERANSTQQFNAMIEAMDTEIGRLTASLAPDTLANTYISFLGDNGTPRNDAPYGPSKTKGSLYQGGVNVPFIVAGPGIKPASTSLALANSTDIFKTVLDLASVTTPTAKSAVHSVSLAPVMLSSGEVAVRDYAFADTFGMSGRELTSSRAIRNERYKLIENILDKTVELYDLKSDPFERNNLLSGTLSKDAKDNMKSLRAQIVTLASSQ